MSDTEIEIGPTAQAMGETAAGAPLRARADRVARYIGRDMRLVDGWLHPVSARAIALFGGPGRAAEIGVHHGKLTVLLSLVCEHVHAIDVFDAALNTDSSGDGDRAAFEANMARYGGEYTVVQTDSALVRAEQLPPIRLFSVDGSHTARMTESDLRLAAAVLEPGGVVVLDDYFNEHWPDVSIGANRVIADGTLLPFGITPGKLLLTNTAPVTHVERLASDAAFHSLLEMAGTKVALLRDTRTVRLRRVLRSPLYRSVKNQPWFAPIKRLGRALFA